ncbi:hypothetical protein F2Q68_00046266 [Brassica cretica]|uniref:Leucine-rich repeat-containing N-terminal plant-type domain-containing protein n=1 Tax=Brassica cretica TaxID=69181 RepID=A0A8S9LPG8_BRACR|nr:hypothetical protein F2Q68_00046266 [Brassica cretica]
MTGSHCFCFTTLYFFLLIHTLAFPPPHFCKQDQRDALLEFIGEFPTSEYTSWWDKSSDCCLWSGISCNQTSGQVISLHLLDTLLNSSLKTNSGLFRLQSLSHLLLRGCNLQGEIPSSLGNLTRLEALDLSDNHLVGEVPTSLGNLNKLRSLSLGSNSFFGPFPKSLFLNPSLESVDLGGNQFTGPLEFVNSSSSSSKLQYLNLGDNRLDGPIPESISNFIHLRQLFINHNNFSGSIPRSISKLVKLRNIHLSNNMLKGEVPGFLWRLTRMVFSHNYFTSFGISSKKPLTQMLDLSSNSFHGPLPHWICKLKQLRVLDLSNNLFNGSIPPCLRSSSGLLVDLILRNNSFSGVIPDIFADATKLQSFDNQRRVSVLVGIFVINTCSHPQIKLVLWAVVSSLRVMDISHNDFTGTLPPHYFSNWREMTTSSGESDQYYFTFIGYNAPWNIYGFISYESVYHSMEMVNKGVEMNFERILKDFRAIDFSGNRISGKIPESVSCLKELRLLNLSDNNYKNHIPRHLSNLTNLETLDLSSNKLSGHIPQNLGKLSFLSYMNFSHNLLQGPVPRGTQFQRQKCSSFLGNPGLYGLEEICQESHVPNQSQELSEAEEQVFSWIAAAIAFGPGLFCGLVIGHIFTSHNQEWFTEKFGRRKHRVVTSAR